MKNDKHSKIIPFPNLKERLIDKGMEALKNKHYQEALELFSEAKHMDEDKAEIHLGIALCLMEMGELQEAKRVCKQMLNEDIGHYFTVLQVYLTILIQLKEYEEVQLTIEAVLQENQVPAENAEQFYKLLEFSRKMNESNGEDIELEEEVPELENWMNTSLFMEDPNQQMQYIQSLKDRNLAKHMKTIKTLLEEPEVHPVIKTMALQLLMENEYDKKVTITKFGETLSPVPSKLSDLSDMPFAKKVLNLLDDVLGSENPTLFEAVKELWIRHLYVLFPLVPTPPDAAIWAAALHSTGYGMHGITLGTGEIEALYEVSEYGVREASRKLLEVEELSYFYEREQ
ncbi:tetratricopeptide repeat protein [Metabacillus sp. GX 13764]|uniref:tetratricopeptide repeat protein n=1 Tax=Metabacillus kandeliae TaxID=2900151 RepID=UPI001E44727B|nr:tetratricopeptide repeat protein [Metabacillus kandeliae]MCD7032881.1 tetratricopeptide repeat protein [Metabacillus kandeliae]